MSLSSIEQIYSISIYQLHFNFKRLKKFNFYYQIQTVTLVWSMILIKRQFFYGTCLTSIKILFLSKLFSNWKIRKKLAGHKHKKVPDAKNKLKKKKKQTLYYP